MPDIAYRMSWTQTGLEETVDKSIQSVEKLSTSTSSLISRLERKASVSDMGADAFALAQAKAGGASQATLDYISALQRVVNKTKEVKDAKEMASRVGGEMLGGLRESVATHGMTSDEIALRRATSAGVDPNTLAEIRAEQQKLSALKATTAAEAEAAAMKRKSKEAGESLVASLERERAELGMNASQLQIYRAKLAGASDADIKKAESIQSEITAMRNRQRLQDQMVAQLDVGIASQGRFSNSNMVVTESLRLAEDAIAGYSNNGLKGMSQATSNNLNQIGSLIGGTAGLAISLGSIAMPIAVTVIPAMLAWNNATRDGAAAKRELAEASRKAFEQEIDQLERLQKQRTDLLDLERKFNREKNDPDKRRSVSELKTAKRQTDDEALRAGFSVPLEQAAIQAAIMKQYNIQDVETTKREARKKRGTLGAGFDAAVDNPVGRMFGDATVIGSLERAALEERDARIKERDEKISASKEIAAEAKKRASVLSKQSKDLDGQIAIQTEVENRKQLEDGIASRKSTKEQDAAERALRRDKRREVAETLGEMRVGLLPGDTRDEKIRKGSLQSELERVKRDKDIDAAVNNGLIDKNQAEEMKWSSRRQRDRQIQDLKGGSQDGGGQKAQASDVRSSEGMAQLLRALNQGQKEEIAKRQLDVTEEIAQAQRDAVAILKDQAKLTVVTWN